MGEMDEALQEFASTGRAGRRNALPDIRGEHASTSTADLPGQMEKMSCSDAGSNPQAAGPSGASGTGGAGGGGDGSAGGGGGDQGQSGS
ncbi:cAMP-dependent protein kinase inhibitor beta-like [Amphibalanus amphitrite]|uniref:cAMP-dependent protein kinase inhibitor beta-like n=1 Tax=Amphibalanus amphitrite TaxID=1232801 RepID=UPI001C923EFA|nr:cAMP-dependent protein kinase inhibitor beta-like [Amphibalanus amphitrite]